MAAIDNIRATFAQSPVRGHRGSLASTFLGTLRSWNDARLTRKALNALTDRELDDIGLVRGDIEAVAAKRG